jgi:hypothetical protein
MIERDEIKRAIQAKISATILLNVLLNENKRSEIPNNTNKSAVLGAIAFGLPFAKSDRICRVNNHSDMCQ